MNDEMAEKETQNHYKSLNDSSSTKDGTDSDTNNLSNKFSLINRFQFLLYDRNIHLIIYFFLVNSIW